jgi:hypothetical protein
LVVTERVGGEGVAELVGRDPQQHADHDPNQGRDRQSLEQEHA